MCKECKLEKADFDRLSLYLYELGPPHSFKPRNVPTHLDLSASHKLTTTTTTNEHHMGQIRFHYSRSCLDPGSAKTWRFARSLAKTGHTLALSVLRGEVWNRGSSSLCELVSSIVVDRCRVLWLHVIPMIFDKDELHAQCISRRKNSCDKRVDEDYQRKNAISRTF